MWSAIHINYHENANRIICDVLAPWLMRALADGRISCFFFLRYWQGGPHVRLRIRISVESDLDKITADVLEMVSGHLRRNPSAFVMAPDDYLSWATNAAVRENVPRVNSLSINNSVTVEQYLPEFDKYGGVDGVSVAEQVFYISSMCCIRLLRHLGEKQSQLLGCAFEMMIQAAVAFGMSVDSALAFFVAYESSWLTNQERESLEGVWRNEFMLKKEKFVRAAMSAIIRSADEADKTQWTGSIKNAKSQLDQLVNHERAARILFHFIHTHNNRLGISLHQEPYLAFLICEAVRLILTREGSGE